MLFYSHILCSCLSSLREPVDSWSRFLSFPYLLKLFLNWLSTYLSCLFRFEESAISTILLFETIPFFYQDSILNCANQGSKTTLFSLFHLFICYWCLLDQYLKAIRVNYALVKRVKSRGCQRRLYFVTFVLIWIGIGNHLIHISFYIWYDNILEWVV